MPNFTLEGHEKGVNCVDYFTGAPPQPLCSAVHKPILCSLWCFGWSRAQGSRLRLNGSLLLTARMLLGNLRRRVQVCEWLQAAQPSGCADVLLCCCCRLDACAQVVTAPSWCLEPTTA